MKKLLHRHDSGYFHRKYIFTHILDTYVGIWSEFGHTNVMACHLENSDFGQSDCPNVRTNEN